MLSIGYKLHQYDFCRNYLKRSKDLMGYESYLKHIEKKEKYKVSFVDIAVYDVLDNDAVNRLIDSLYTLKRNNEDYTVEIYYRKKRLLKRNYVSGNLMGTQTGSIAEIRFKKDRWFRSIRIAYTYINNSEMVIQYVFEFRQIMNGYALIHKFNVDMLPNIRIDDYFHSYADKNIIRKASCIELLQIDEVLFPDILQGIICTYFYSVLGRRYKLPVEYAEKIERINRKGYREIRDSFLSSVYIRNNEYLIEPYAHYDRQEYRFIKHSRNYPNPCLLGYFSVFSTEMYYRAFGTIEMSILEQRMRKYLNARKRLIKVKDVKWLINKCRYIRDREEQLKQISKPENKKYVESRLGWNEYYSGEKVSNGDFMKYPECTSRYFKLYEQNLQYLDSISNVENNGIIMLVTNITLVITVLSFLCSLLFDLPLPIGTFIKNTVSTFVK